MTESQSNKAISVEEEQIENKSAVLEPVSAVDDQLIKNFGQGDDLELDKKYIRRLIRKIDMRIMPGLGLLYSVSLIDKVNLASVSRTFQPYICDSKSD